MGSSRPVEGLRHMHRTPSSPDISPRQRGTRCNIHAGRQLIDKGLRYLKTVRVTAAVYQGFTALKSDLTHWYWAVLNGYTNRFRFAATYVF